MDVVLERCPGEPGMRGSMRRPMADPEYHTPPKDLIPELIMLGEFRHEEAFFDNGTCIEMDLITYEGKTYMMKQYKTSRWFDER